MMRSLLKIKEADYVIELLSDGNKFKLVVSGLHPNEYFEINNSKMAEFALEILYELAYRGTDKNNTGFIIAVLPEIKKFLERKSKQNG